ncbi:hypothetical protein [Halomonas organivorans]|uniref:Uncharacterized protein n=1 Tax=Halomonas organivorans TaxID=257772 RepID=A0A7W5BZL5_9GAMM|nr:hypothetical protein [Halomonas organivorans]MBB3141922.1 hypothetical protein [Halomonas organivorans]
MNNMASVALGMSMDTPSDSTILFSPGPSNTFILLCSCGNSEVSRDRHAWEHFRPDFERDRCRCLACGLDVALTYNDDPRLHFRKP